MLDFKDREKIEALKEKVPSAYSLEALKKAFLDVIERNTANLGKCAVLFSGGIDSTIVAYAVTSRVKNTLLYCCGLPKASSFARAEQAAKRLGLKLKKIEINKEKLPELVKKTIEAIGTQDKLQVQIALPEFITMQAIKEDSFKVVFCGQGADELFAGYNEFRFVLKEKGFAGVQELIWKKLFEMYERNLKRDLAIANYFGLELRAPFLDEEFILQALAFPPEEKIHSESDLIRKHALRKLAEALGIPKKLCYEKKKAIQYDTGLAKEVERILKGRN